MRARANITVELGPTINAVTRTGAGDLNPVEFTRLTVQDWLDAMRLPVDAHIEFKQVDSVRGPAFVDVAVILNDVRCGFSKRQLRQVYESSQQRPLPYESAAHAAQEVLAGNDEKLHQAHGLLADLVDQAVQSSSEAVITPEVTDALLARARDEHSALHRDIKVINRSLVTDVLRRLTRAHIVVQDAGAFVKYIREGQANGSTAAELAEKLIDRWRPRAIEIHVDPVLAGKLLRDEPVLWKSYPATEVVQEFADMLGMMYDGLFYELGIWLPGINVVVNPELTNGFCRFRLHERLTPMLHSLADNELLVNELPERLKLAGIPDARPTVNPANANPCAIISKDSQAKLPVGLTTWDHLGYIVLLLSNEVRSAAPILLSLNDVENTLGKLNDIFPELIAATLHQYSQLEVAQVLRWLLRDGIAIRNIRTVLELMLDFSYTTGVRSPTAGWGGREPYVYVGDAEFNGEPYFTEKDPYTPQFDIGSMQLFTEPAPEWIATGRIHAEFVKCGLRDYVTHKTSRGQNTIICYLLDADIEMRLQAATVGRGTGKPPFSEQEVAQILKGMSKEFVENYGPPVLFLATTPDVALLVQDMIRQDFPEVTVLHRQLIEEIVNVQPVARVPGFETATSTS